MKKLFTMMLAAVMLLCMLAGCGSKTAPEASDGSAGDSTEVNLMDMYTVKDPDGVEYDQRIALYMPVLESDEHYADGARNIFCVLYGKEDKGVYMYNVEIYETEEQAVAYRDEAEAGEVDGTVYINESNADFFAAMESFIPDFQTWIDNMKESGMIDLE